MKNKLSLFFILVIAAVIVGYPAFHHYRLARTDTTPMWDAVKAAQDKGLPQTAIAELKKIYPIELAKKQYGKALKAITLQIFLESNIAGNKPEVKVNRMKEELTKANRQMKPLMNTVLAQWYWHYYNQNRWRFLNRTETSGLKEDDFTTWDLPKLFREIDGIYQSLLKDEGTLKRMKTADFTEVISPGNVPALRPTLFDFVAYQALEFYTSAEQHAAQPEDSFEVTADSGAFDEAQKFTRFSPETTDTDSPVLKALRIYQRLLLLHQNDSDKDAFLDADISRLNYIFNIASGENREAVFAKRLEEIITKYPSSDLSSLASYHLAMQAYNKKEYVKAYSLAEKGKNAYPSSYGGQKCEQLQSSIKEKSLALKIEGIVPPGIPSKLLVHYRNIDSLTLRVLKDDWKRYLDINRSIQYINDSDLEAFLSKKPAAELTVPLKPTSDYRQKEALIDLPALPPGFYRVLASNRKDFARSENCIEHCPVWVSNVAAVIRERNGAVEGIVVEGTSGAPVGGAVVKAYTLKDYNEKFYKVTSSTTTDGGGSFSLPSPSGDFERRSRIYVNDGRGSEFLESNESYYYSEGEREKAFQSMVFFTDRSIYRPGQAIHFKGIALDIDQQRQNYKVTAARKVTVRFTDTNGQEIAKSGFTTNDFGSFSGTFTAPKDRLPGRMTIASADPEGSCTVSVEEYKRPKFSVKIVTPKKAFTLGEEVTIEGGAESYSGAPIDGAKVAYKVNRQVMMPPWERFFGGGGVSYGDQELAHGTLVTDKEGKFRIIFQAKPDARVKKSGEPTFLFRIAADVTDSTGETRSDEKSIRLGYTSMEATISADSWQVADRPVTLSIHTATLDGEPQKASGEVELFCLRQPKKPVRPGLDAAREPSNSSGDEEEEDAGPGEVQEDAGPNDEGIPAPSTDYQSWPRGGLVKKMPFTTDDKGSGVLSVPLGEGSYRARLTTKDPSGNKVTAMVALLVVNSRLEKFPVSVPSYFVSKSQSVEAGETFEAFWGTGYGTGQACVEIYREESLLRRYWTPAHATQSIISFPVTASLRGGFTVMVTYVRENKLYTHRSDVDVPWSDRELKVSLETFRSKLLPGGKETWTLKVRGPGAEKRAAELVATLYDESLDAYLPHQWQTLLAFFFRNYTTIRERFSNRDKQFHAWLSDWNQYPSVTERAYPAFIAEIAESLSGYEYMKCKATGPGAGGGGRGFMEKDDASAGIAPSAPAPQEAEFKKAVERAPKTTNDALGGVPAHNAQEGKKSSADGSSVRKNLNETAFFFPHLLSGSDGTVRIVFTIPEALTKWHFLAMAHGKAMESGVTEGHTVTQKDLMVVPNAPRFLREGDELEFTAKVISMAEKEIEGTVTLTFFDPSSGQSLDRLLGNSELTREFTIPPKQSKGFSWKIKVPDGLCAAGYRATAETGSHRDGEEGVTPVLPRRVFVSESIPLWIRGPGEKSFTFEKLKKSGSSKTLVNQGFTVQIASNPSWYAVQALPYLMEFPHECSEQVFNRLYANTLARHIATSNPRIARVFRTWKEQQPSALDSQLEKNDELKSVLLLESPWVLEAKKESEAKRNIGVLFDEKRLGGEIASAQQKLSKMQLDSGGWPWFPGGRPDPFITLYIATGFGRLQQMQAGNLDMSCALRSIDFLDRWIAEEYQQIVTHGREKDNNLSSTIALYIYCRGFYAKAKPVPQQSKAAVDYFLGQARKHWLDLGVRMSQAHIAMGLWKLGDQGTPKDIMASIKERSQSSEELGMFWGEDEQAWWWYRAPIETQALMIEAFGAVMNDEKAVEDCKVWLLKQKETQDWKTTKATADAIYSLLCKGGNLLAGSQPVEVTVGGAMVDPGRIEEGTGFYEKRWDGPSVKADFGTIVLKKQDKGIAWGGAHWQYMEDISKLTPSAQNPLKLNKSVFLQKNTKKGPVIEPVSRALAPGDLLKIRIELRSDRDMEYVHMWDHRGSGLEPVNVLSGYKYQDGLYYYEATKDTASHFFIDYLPKGTYVFEYPLRVVHCGAYQNGAAHVECMYAPQFSSHSGSVELHVK
ncbi:MAG: MG2 domain-containing protein [Candidatus Eremiobacteraeota bacterium]|nr:MG2 domain-containing protein [Candidatus Eremiobacteraeota bacterium]